MKVRAFIGAGLAAGWLIGGESQEAKADPFSSSKDRARSTSQSGYSTSPDPRNPVSPGGTKLGSGVKELNKTESLQLQGKFQGYRPTDNSIVLLLDAKYVKYETVFLGKTTKFLRGDKEIKPTDLKSDEMLTIQVTKTQGRMTATQVTAPAPPAPAAPKQ